MRSRFLPEFTGKFVEPTAPEATLLYERIATTLANIHLVEEGGPMLEHINELYPSPQIAGKPHYAWYQTVLAQARVLTVAITREFEISPKDVNG